MGDEYAELLVDLMDRGALDSRWLPAFQTARRDLFVPARIWTGDGPEYRETDRADSPLDWARAVNEDEPIITQLTDGVPTSSGSMPYMVALMLRYLDVDDGDKVLEIGTGTGWTAGLLSARLGGGNVVSIEVDAEVAAQAADALGAAGHAPTLLLGDGAAGHPLRAPYDRLIATCSVRRVPSAWVAQTRGVILTPWGNGMSNGTLLRLESDGTTAIGRVVDTSSFMWLREQTPDRRVHGDEGDRGDAGTDPREIFADHHRLFAIGLRVPGCRYSVGWGDGDEADECTLWLSDGASWARAEYAPGRDPWTVQAGPRRLWDEVRTAYDWWTEKGRPELTRFGLTVDRHGQRAWLDAPGDVL